MSGEVASPANDPGIFAEKLLGRPLWPHQLEVARSSARYRVICAGRQVGKSSVLATIALFEAFTRRNILVMLISAGEAASQRLLEECAALAGHSDMLRGSVLDESKSLLTLSNGSRILSVPASEKQIRGWSVDLLIADEAAFISGSVWSAAEPAIIARPGSRVILTSTPFGIDHFFRRLWRRGMDSPDAMYASWHWPSTVSPLISEDLLEEIRQHENPITFAREYLAEWADASGLLLTPDELQNSVLDYELVHPRDAHDHGQFRTHRFLGGSPFTEWELPRVIAGLDWGSAQDANAVVMLAALDDDRLNVPERTNRFAEGDHVFFVPHLEVHHRMLYGDFIDRLEQLASTFYVHVYVSETNGVGAYPTEELVRRLDRAWVDRRLAGWGHRKTWVSPVWTDNRRKQAMFGRLKGFLQQGRLVLPQHPELLSQLAALEMTETAAGNVQISVPETRGHDDLAMALGQALAGIGDTRRVPNQRYWLRPTDRPPQEVVTMPTGTRVPMPPRMLAPDNPDVFDAGVAGTEKDIRW
ncbi:terminase family protein [Curtobacterium sp. MCBD17_035]|uniref:terminase large subunit domain-containing protein n=1 Tax=Curtobacterium sp. MCBD17_035 TaxID=2175673 RepID=UPI000DA80430|nr:terminase family protein [Curtobacterium sp. MCBD17_035]WIB68075.1 terminase family protein [Curtobacterium sp. MCBD17_035]